MIAVGDNAFQAPTSAEETIDPLVMRGDSIGLGDITINTMMDHAHRICRYLSSLRANRIMLIQGVWSAELFNHGDMLDMSIVLLAYLAIDSKS